MNNDLFFKANLILNIIITIQGLVFGFIFLRGIKKSPHLLYFGLVIVGYSLDSLMVFFEDSKLFFNEEFYFLFPSDFTFIMSPLLYIYLQKIPELKEKRINYNGLYIGIVGYVITFVLFLLPINLKVIIEASTLYLFFEFLSLLFSLAYILISYNYIKNKKKELQSDFFNANYSESKWAYNFVKLLLFSIFGLIGAIIILIIFQLLSNINSPLYTFIFSLLDTVFLYILIIYGLKHKYLKSFHLDFSSKKRKNSNEVKSKDDIVEFEKIINSLYTFLKTSEAFKKSDFSITDASVALNIHTKKISTALNSLKAQNFNSFINEFRIEEAKKLLEQNASSDYTIEGIGNLVGFNSKSVFYKEFKKNMGMTPLHYLKVINE